VEFEASKIEQFDSFVENTASVAIFVHQNPDGDALGSASCFCRLFESLGKTATVISPNECPPYLSFLHGFADFVDFEKQTTNAVNALDKADSVLFLDFNKIDRIGTVQKSLSLSGKNTLLIDHHPDPEEFAEILFSNVTVSSTAELTFHILHASGYWSAIDAVAAEALLTGIITDTGGFSHNCSKHATYEAVAALLEKGADREKIHTFIFQSNNLNKLQLLGNCIGNSMRVFPEYGAALMTITLKDKQIYNFSSGDSEGIVNYPLSVKGINFCALFTENEDMVKVSFRSKGTFPANAFSEKYFNGGGHLNAAGGRVQATLQEAIALFEKGLSSFESELKALLK